MKTPLLAGAAGLDPEGVAAGVAPTGEAEPVAWTVAGDVTNWARDFSKYRTQHYVRPVFAHPAPAAAGVKQGDAEQENGA